MDPHNLSQVNFGCPDDRRPKLKIYISIIFRQIVIHTSTVRRIALHDFTIITDFHPLRGYRVFHT